MPRKVSFEERRGTYQRLWDTCEIRPEKRPQIEWHVGQIMRNRARYKNVENITGIPWWFTGLIHAMEASYNFKKHLHNGDSLRGRTRRVPAGRIPDIRPPYSWESSAEDALTMPGKRFQRYTTWRIDEVCYRLEMYNGWGYYLYRGIQSPYLWSYTNHYSRGKYVRDGKWDAREVSGQAGAVGILKRLQEIDPTIKAALDGVPISGAPEPRLPDFGEPDYDPNPQPKTDNPRDDVKKSRKWNLMNWLKWIGGGLGLTGFSANLGSASGVAELNYYTQGIKNMWDVWGPIGLIILLGIVVLVVTTIQKWQEEDVQEGRYVPSGEDDDDNSYS